MHRTHTLIGCRSPNNDPIILVETMKLDSKFEFQTKTSHKPYAAGLDHFQDKILFKIDFYSGIDTELSINQN